MATKLRCNCVRNGRNYFVFAVYFFADRWGGEAHTLNMPFGLEDAVCVY